MVYRVSPKNSTAPTVPATTPRDQNYPHGLSGEPKMNKQHYIKPATIVFAVQPLAILAGSGTGNIQENRGFSVDDEVKSGDADDVWA